MLDRLSPVRRGARRAEMEHALLLRNCRIVYATSALLILAFGAVHRIATPEAIDPWSTRVALAAFCGSLLFASFYSEGLKRHCTEITAVFVCALTVWFIIVTGTNDFSAAYGLGLVFMVAACGFALLVTQDGIRPVLFFAVVSAVTVSLGVLLMQPPRANALLIIGGVAGIDIVVVLSARLRTHLIASLESSEKRFRKLSEAAFEAIFITDDDIIVDCNTNALVLLGHSTRDRLLGCALSDFMPRSERSTPATPAHPDSPYRFDATMMRSDGALVPVEIRGRSAGEKGQDVRVVAVRDISEQKEYERKLIESRRRVEETLEIRNTILANVSHEFRTPLAIILGYSEMLKEEKFDDAAELGQLIYDSGRKLNDTLNLILELAQIEGGGFALTREDVDVAELVQDVVRSHRQRASLKHLELSFNAGESGNRAMVDRVRVLKIIDYLVDNAIKFTDEGTIDIRVESEPEWTHISVKDSGIGIGQPFLTQIFEPFKQESSGLTRSYGGLGVGLTIACHMAESMGGSITAKSKKGEGSTFTVVFPRSSGARPPSRHAYVSGSPNHQPAGSLEVVSSASGVRM